MAMNNYKIVAPKDFTEEQTNYINQLKYATTLLSEQISTLMLIKDIDSRLIVGSDASAKVFGLTNGRDLSGMCISDIPCPSVAEHAQQFKLQDEKLMKQDDITTPLECLDVIGYSDGVKTSITTKQIVFHQPSLSILGTTSTAFRVKLRDFVNIIPRYSFKFGAIGSVESINSKTKLLCDIKLTDYEQEICFLLLLDWSYKEIAEFMNQSRPERTTRSADTIIKKKDRICQKLLLRGSYLKTLIDYLVSINFHHKMPSTFYSRIIGTKIL